MGGRWTPVDLGIRKREKKDQRNDVRQVLIIVTVHLGNTTKLLATLVAVQLQVTDRAVERCKADARRA
jgi:hypothetical protein